MCFDFKGKYCGEKKSLIHVVLNQHGEENFREKLKKEQK